MDRDPDGAFATETKRDLLEPDLLEFFVHTVDFSKVSRSIGPQQSPTFVVDNETICHGTGNYIFEMIPSQSFFGTFFGYHHKGVSLISLLKKG